VKTLFSSLVAVAILVGSPPVRPTAWPFSTRTRFLTATQRPPSISATPFASNCKSNVDPGKAVEAALNAGYGGEQAGKILFAASHQLCPDTAAAVDKWSNSP
jgi:hypothetical protein